MHRCQATQNHSILRNILHWILDSVNQELPTICTKANAFNYEINIFGKKKVSHLNLLGNYEISNLFKNGRIKFMGSSYSLIVMNCEEKVKV